MHNTVLDRPRSAEAPHGPAARNAFQCHVVVHESARALLPDVLGALARLRGLVASCAHEPAAAGACDVAIFVCSRESAPDTLAQLDRWRREWPSLPVLLAAGGLDAAQIGMAFDHGVQDFVSLPVGSEELAARLQRACGAPRATPSRPADPRLRDFIGSNPAFVRELRKVPVYAACEAGVLIVGETGTGKEVCAQAVHCLSSRGSKPWVAVNCGALPTELVEDELFGHAKGAFTTAHVQRAGLVSHAEGGTLFLDDIDCLPLPAQVKLLRFLQEGEYRPVGSNALCRANVRVIAAGTNRLPAMVSRGEFRQDLYFRLNVLVLQLPPLRERRDDIPALALHFVRRFAAQHRRRVDALAPRALERLFAHSWEGNVRELQHVIERAVLLATGPVLQEGDIDIAAPATAAANVEESLRAAKGRIVRQFERSYIEHLLASCEGNVTHAARQAGKNRRAFFELMRKHEIAAAPYRPGAEPRVIA